MYHSPTHEVLAEGFETNHMFSSKPIDGYRDYHHKLTTYEDMISRHARQIDPEATAKVFPVIPDDEDDSVFNYIDTASSRAGIGVIAEKLKVGPVALVGLGGTGSYVLDLLAKTPVAQIHLFDGDRFDQHNAFRSPGGPSIDELQEKRQKVEHFAAQYSGMRKAVIPHDCFIDETNVHQLREMSFVFLALDKGEPKKLVVAKLEDSACRSLMSAWGSSRPMDRCPRPCARRPARGPARACARPPTHPILGRGRQQRLLPEHSDR